MNPKVSIIIPVYNASLYLEQCLECVINQTLKDIEIICVDDGSTDSSVSIINSYAQIDNRIKILQQKNQFAGVARNTGLANATGKYIIFLDSDDNIKKDMIQELYEKAENTSADIVLCKIIKKNIRLGTLVEAEYSLKTELLNASVFNYEDIPNSIFQLTIPAPFNKFYLKSFLINKKLQFQALHNANDMYMSYAALALADKIAYVDKALYIYQFNAKGNLSSKRKKSPFCFIEALIGLKDTLIEHNRFDILKQSFITLCLGQYVYQLNEMKDVITRYEILKEVLKDPLSVLQYPEECYSKTDKQNRGKLKELEQIINWQYQSLKWEMSVPTILVSNKVKDPIVTVIIPVYNVEKYVGDCLKSIISQSLENIEILCIDDGSTDFSRERVLKIARQDSRISVITEKNSGQSVARNTGIQHARGKYIYYMDADDILEKDALKSCVKYMEERDLQLVYFDGNCFCDGIHDDELLRHYNDYYQRDQRYEEVYSGIELFEQQKNNKEFLVSPCFQMVKREFLISNQIQFFPGIIHEDELYTFQSLVKATRVGYIHETFYHRRLRSNSTMTRRNTFKNVYGYFKVFLEMQKVINDFLSNDMDADLLLGHVKRTLSLAQDQYVRLNRYEKMTYLALPKDERFLFEYFVLSPTQKQHKNSRLTDSQRQIKAYKQELQNVKSGYSFRIGRKITWLPRMIRGGLKCFRDHGVSYTIKRAIEHSGINMGTGDFRKRKK